MFYFNGRATSAVITRGDDCVRWCVQMGKSVRTGMCCLDENAEKSVERALTELARLSRKAD